jgi:hypothetical protein
MKQIFLFTLLVGVSLLAACQPNSSNSIPSTSDDNMPGQAATPQAEATVTQVFVPQTGAATATSLPDAAQSGDAARSDNAAQSGDAAGSADPIEDISAALLALSDQQSFRVEQTITSPDGDMVSQIEILPPDRFHMLSQDLEMIVIEQNAYVKVDEGWMSYPGSADAILGFFIFLKNEEDAEVFRGAISNASYLGEENLDGEATRVYQYEVMDPEESASGKVKIWVASSDGLPRRQEVDITETEDPQGSARIVNIYKDFNVPLTIEPPQ